MAAIARRVEREGHSSWFTSREYGLTSDIIRLLARRGLVPSDMPIIGAHGGGLLEQKLFEIARTIGKVDPTTGEVAEDFRSEILGFLGSSPDYQVLYKRALVDRDDPWPQILGAVNTEADELDPAPSPDGRWLYFTSNRPGGLTAV